MEITETPKILLIDDNKSITEMLSKYLKMKKFDCTVCNSGRVALGLITKEKYDSILLDLSMPEFSGIDVINELEKKGTLKDQKIIIFTASSIDNKDIDALLKRGVYSCIKKPVELSELINLLSKH